MPRRQITLLAGSGGVGKTSVWCAIAAQISSGKRTFLSNGFSDGTGDGDTPETVMFFSAEDSAEYVLRRRLRKNGADLNNIFTIDLADERFREIKFDSKFLSDLLDKYRPSLVIFDPIQAFIGEKVRMAERNAMRSCVSPLIALGEKFGCTFLLVCHANKMSGVWGKKRIADSADLGDISRSVIMAGECSGQKGLRYLSHEKSNYGMTGETVLYEIEDEVIEFKGNSAKKDKDFILEELHNDADKKPQPTRDAVKKLILEYLKENGEAEVSELDDYIAAMSISRNTLGRAKTDLKNDGKIKYRTESRGKEKGVKHYISLIYSNRWGS